MEISANETWTVTEIEKQKFLLLASEKNGEWKIALTNLRQVWLEHLTQENILQRCKDSNPLLDMEDFKKQEIQELREFINDLLKNIPKFSTKSSTKRIDLSATLYDAVFEFHIDLKEGNPGQLWDEVMVKLCRSVSTLQSKFDVLLDIVKKKDAEIAEYKAEGAKLIRKNIETEPFDCKVLNQANLKGDSSDFIRTIGAFLNSHNPPEIDVVQQSTANLSKGTPGLVKEETLNAENDNQGNSAVFSNFGKESETLQVKEEPNVPENSVPEIVDSEKKRNVEYEVKPIKKVKKSLRNIIF